MPSDPAPVGLDARVHRLVLGELEPGHDRSTQARLVERRALEVAPLLSPAELERTVERVLARVVGLGPLEDLLADPTVSEVMVNGPGPVWVERHGQLEQTPLDLDRSTIDAALERIVAPLGLRIDRTSPVVDARLADGSRVHAVIPPLAVDGPYVTIRRFEARPLVLESMCAPDVAAMLRAAVRARANIVISGGTGAGKTTLLNTLAAEIGDGQRVVTVEDAAELRLPGRHVVRLEARTATVDGLAAVPIRELVRNALRMRPDRIVVGEVRGPEALDMVQAMNTGHEGSLSTCHANSPPDALRRLEAMILMYEAALPAAVVRDQIDAALDLVVQVARFEDGSRGVVEVAEVVDDPQRLRPVADGAGLHREPTRWRCRR